jgi:segregation and condensation protein B
MKMEKRELFGALEAMLFVCGEPAGFAELAEALDISELEVRTLLCELQAQYEREGRGIALRFVAEKAQLCTNARYAPQIERLLQPEKTKQFSQSVIETLSIIAYKQPVTRAEIEQIRAVRCEYSLNQLLNLGLIEEVGRKQTIGRPALFGTTDKFLQQFGISCLDELPNREQILNPEEIEQLNV